MFIIEKCAMVPMDLKRTPLYECHLELSAKMVDFAGWVMPLQYSGIIEEHMRVRNSCGIFDVSHMGDVLIEGPKARDLLLKVLTNNIDLATIGKGIYSHILRPDGTIIDDTIVYNLGDERYLLVPNASTKETVLTWIMDNNPGAVVTDLSDMLASIAVQGPMAQEVLQRISRDDLSSIKRFHLARMSTMLPPVPQNSLNSLFPISESKGMDCVACRTGYTGEDGFELLIDAENAPLLWNALMEAGGNDISPAGLGCRDTLRLEKGMLLSGTDFHGSQSSLQTGPRWVVKMDHDFIGREALEAQENDPEMSVLVGLLLEEKGIPRHGHKILKDDIVIGEVTSGTMSPVLKKGIALGYVPRRNSRRDERLRIDVRGHQLEARVVPIPFL